jgi:hypothetical protein
MCSALLLGAVVLILLQLLTEILGQNTGAELMAAETLRA